MTSEQLGQLIGVSGATVRRWETGRSRPGFADVSAVANVCELTAIEAALLHRVFRAREGADHPPSEASFERALELIKSADNPAFLMDNFMFVRARNAYAESIQGEQEPPGKALHPIPFWLTQVRGAGTPEELAEREAVLDRWLRDFWYWSAFQCGTPAYVRLIRSFAKHEGFAERWRSMGSAQRTDGDELIGGPYQTFRRQWGLFRALPVRVFLPPLYTVVELIPVDDTAIARTQSIRDTRPKAVERNASIHWSVDRPLPDDTYDLGNL